MATNTIPGIQIENIGTRKRPLHVIKGFIELPCWDGYFLTEQPDYIITTPLLTHGRIALWVDGKVMNDDNFTTSQEQINAYVFLSEQQEKIKASILQALKDAFPRLLANDYASWDQDNGYLPGLSDLTPGFDFKNYIGPASISIGTEIKDESAYITWHFQCLWDPEHGFEVITHKNRVIDLAPQADIFSIHKDNGTYEQLEKKLKDNDWKVPGKKKWWQFW